jgi:predicted SnoaL-like aldol condensation-catalyzing enzyme
MAKKSILILTLAFGAMIPGAARAQAQQPAPVQANPAPGCTASPAEIAANKKVATQFFVTRGADRVALADPTYKQHNPAFKKRGEDEKISDYDEFKNTFLALAAAPPPAPAAGPQPPAGNPFEVITAECDIVTVVHKNFRQDPTAAPGKFYEVFTFDTFRIRNGKLVEHWDGAVINPPTPPSRP